MIRFNNDYSKGAHPAVLDALLHTNTQMFEAYGLDDPSREAADLLRAEAGCPDADVHFPVGGTQANLLVISAALRTYQSVLAADTSHIHCHETGAAEATGHKIELLPATDGKIRASQIRDAAEAYRTSPIPEHITQPGMVYLSFPTEYGTLYSKSELSEISEVCRAYALYLFVDGARMAYGLGCPANDLTLQDFAVLTDAFTVGGTKCGALFGEAIVLTHPLLKKDFRAVIKQHGAMLAKGWLSGLQFSALLRDGLYVRLGARACRMADDVREALKEKGLEFCPFNPTNQIFVLLSGAQRAALEKQFVLEPEGTVEDGRHLVRICTAWYTEEDDLRALKEAIRALPET